MGSGLELSPRVIPSARRGPRGYPRAQGYLLSLTVCSPTRLISVCPASETVHDFTEFIMKSQRVTSQEMSYDFHNDFTRVVKSDNSY